MSVVFIHNRQLGKKPTLNHTFRHFVVNNLTQRHFLVLFLYLDLKILQNKHFDIEKVGLGPNSLQYILIGNNRY